MHILAGEPDARHSSRPKKKSDDDESIQAFVFERARQFGYGLRIIPRVKELIFGRSSKSKPSKASSHSNSISNIREKRKLIDFRRPPRLTAHVTNNQKTPRKISTGNLF